MHERCQCFKQIRTKLSTGVTMLMATNCFFLAYFISTFSPPTPLCVSLRIAQVAEIRTRMVSNSLILQCIFLCIKYAVGGRKHAYTKESKRFEGR